MPSAPMVFILVLICSLLGPAFPSILLELVFRPHLVLIPMAPTVDSQVSPAHLGPLVLLVLLVLLVPLVLLAAAVLLDLLVPPGHLALPVAVAVVAAFLHLSALLHLGTSNRSAGNLTLHSTPR